MAATYFALTKSDATVYGPALSAVWVSVTGNVAILGLHDTAPVTLPSVPVGFLAFPYPVSQVLATGTTATVSVGVAAGGS